MEVYYSDCQNFILQIAEKNIRQVYKNVFAFQVFFPNLCNINAVFSKDGYIVDGKMGYKIS